MSVYLQFLGYSQMFWVFGGTKLLFLVAVAIIVPNMGERSGFILMSNLCVHC